MKEKKLREAFLCAGARLGPDPAGRSRAFALLSRAAREKEIRYDPGWADLLRAQMSGIPAAVWAAQLCLLCMLPLLEWALERYTDLEGWQVFPALSVCMAAAGLLTVQELAGHFSHRMAELEQSCYLNLSQLWLLRACCLSGTDVILVLMLSGLRARAHGFGMFAFAVYVLTPFFLSNLVFLSVFRNGRGRGRAWFWGAAFTGLSVCAQCVFPQIYDRIWLPVWTGLLVLAAVCCGMQTLSLCRRMEGEIVCWN